jgi:hypothetical protein
VPVKKRWNVEFLMLVGQWQSNVLLINGRKALRRQVEDAGQRDLERKTDKRSRSAISKLRTTTEAAHKFFTHVCLFSTYLHHGHGLKELAMVVGFLYINELARQHPSSS